MKTFLVLSQAVYALFLIPWLLVWGLSFMSFDQGISLSNSAFVAGVGVYPIAVTVCSLLGWLLRKRRIRTAIIVNLLPLLWILGLGIPVLFLSFS